MEYVYFMLGILAAAVLALLYLLFVFGGSKIAQKRIKSREKEPDDRPKLPCPDSFDSICNSFFSLIAEIEEKEAAEKTNGKILIDMESNESGTVSAACLYAVKGKPVAQIARDLLMYSNLLHGESLIKGGKGWYETSSKNENIHYKCDKVEGFMEYFAEKDNNAEAIADNIREAFCRLLPAYEVEKCDLEVDTQDNKMKFSFEAK